MYICMENQKKWKEVITVIQDSGYCWEQKRTIIRKGYMRASGVIFLDLGGSYEGNLLFHNFFKYLCF